MPRVVVVGSGVAGLFVALQAAKLGAPVTLVAGRAGASALASGAWDSALDSGAAADSLDAADLEAVRAFLADAPITLGQARIVTTAGVVRSCFGRDEAVLGVVLSAPIVVPRVSVSSWDADAMAASLDEQARACGGSARAVDADLFDATSLLRAPLGDVAVRFEDEAALERLGERLRALREVVGEEAQVLLPPILGVAPRVIRRLREVAGDRLGETLGDPGGVAAARFRAWSRAAMSKAGVLVKEGDVRCVAQKEVTLADASTIDADRVVLALGGLVTSGLAYRTGEHDDAQLFPAASVAPLHLGIVVDHSPEIALVLDGRPIEPAGSLSGADADRWFAGAAPAIVRAGLPVDAHGAVVDRTSKPSRWLFAAGDLVAGQSRTLLAAACSGVRAGRSAAG